MAKVILMANEKCAAHVAEHVLRSGDTIERLYLSKHGRCNEASISAAKVAPENIFYASALKSDVHIEELKQLDFDFIITVQWPYLLKPAIYKLAKVSTVNFHPALLPYGRGWYPHVHNIVRKSRAGVTLHAIDEGADTGPIWSQKEVPIRNSDQAKDLYLRLQDAMTELFQESWSKIKSGELELTPQNHTDAVYFEKSEIAAYDELDVEKTMKVGDVLDLLRARSFGDRGFAFIKEDGKKYFLNLRFTPEDR